MRTLVLIFVAVAATACDADHGRDAETHFDPIDTDSGAGTGGKPVTGRVPGDLTAVYNVDVDVISDTCSPEREIVSDIEVLSWGDRARNLFRLPLPNTNVSNTADRVVLAQLEVPLDQPMANDMLVASCPDVHMDIETGPFEVSDKRIVTPYTATWHHDDACSDSRVLRTGYEPPASDCTLQVVLTLDWARACPPPPPHFVFPDGGVAVYCE